MSIQDRTPIDRRHALKAGTLSALGVGLMAAATGTPQPAAAQQQQPAASFLAAPAGHDEAYRAWLADFQEAYQPRHALVNALRAEIEALLPADRAWELVDRLDIAISELYELQEARTIEMVAQHLPGIAAALRLVYQHTIAVHENGALDCCAGVQLW
jgi:hypothetical protein